MLILTFNDNEEMATKGGNKKNFRPPYDKEVVT